MVAADTGAPMCHWCKYLYDREEGPLACTAYPRGIPEPILNSEIDHRLPYRGDHGVRFADDGTLPEGYMARMFPRTVG